MAKKTAKKKAKEKTPPPPPRTREELVAEKWHSIRCCWSEWRGPKVFTDEADSAGFCSIDGVTAKNLTHGDTRYSYMVPARIIEISEDRETFIVETAYTNPACHCYPLNGERWEIDILDLWPPTDRLWKERHAWESAPAPTEARFEDVQRIKVK